MKFFLTLTALVMVISVMSQSDQKAKNFFLEKSPQHIRILSWNVGKESIFKGAELYAQLPGRPEQFVRILKAINPDILCLQEIWPQRHPDSILQVFEKALPLPGKRKWKLVREGDNVVISSFDLQALFSKPFDQRGARNVNALIDLPDETNTKNLCVVCSHFKSGVGEENVSKRNKQSDLIVSWIRDAKNKGGEVDLTNGTPIMIMGDLNAYNDEPNDYLTSLLSGNISNETEYGTDLSPDWDNSPLTDLLPKHNSTGTESYTFRNDLGPFKPGTLDRIIYTDNVLEIKNAFVFNTTLMSELELTKYGLKEKDTMLDPVKGVHDHFPMVVDLTVRK
jgi:endonuclease/exonuclease/phosphatase family metal-dependent hydrolase